MEKGNIPGFVFKVLKKLNDAGYAAYAVGGCVRDKLLGRRPHDWDVTSSASMEEVCALFPGAVVTGEKYGTVTVPSGGRKLEVTTFRDDGWYLDGRHPESVRFLGSLSDDLKRRDFTVNAMAMDLFGNVTDLFGGRRDLDAGLLRCVGIPRERFSEDALRMLRAFRFSAQLGFAVEEETLRAVREQAPMAAALSAERVRIEMEKILLSPRPETVARTVEYGLLDGYLSRLPLSEKTLKTLTKLPENARYRWAAFAAILKQAGAVESCETFLTGLRLDGKTVRFAGTGAELAQKKFASDEMTLKRLVADWGEETAFCTAAAAGPLWGFCRYRHLAALLKAGECCSLQALAVSGDDLLAEGLSGAEVGAELRAALDRVIDHPKDNRKEMLLRFLRERRETDREKK